jgi:hypothetical protein
MIGTSNMQLYNTPVVAPTSLLTIRYWREVYY